LSENEVVSTRFDNRGPGRGFPTEGFAKGRDRGDYVPGRAVVWNATDVADFQPAPVWGAYPQGFVAYALKALRCPPTEVLHVCSGALTRAEVLGGVRLDLRAAAHPDVRGDGCNLPFRESSFSYSKEYALELYGTEYPRPSHLLGEASRVLRPGGRVGFLHFLVPMVGKNKLRFERCQGVTQGCGYRIRAFTVFVKRGPSLWDGAA